MTGRHRSQERRLVPGGRDLPTGSAIGPVTQATDLQIICVFKHNPAGDKYIEAMADFNGKLSGLCHGDSFVSERQG